MTGLTVHVPAGWTLDERDANLATAEQVGQVVVIRDAHGTITLHFARIRHT
jgi:hypothetical protein